MQLLRLPSVILCILTALGLLAAFLSSLFHAPKLVIWSLYALTYVAGSWQGVKSAYASFRSLKIDIDFLMICAAIGAAMVGAPAEGGLLLLLFSLSNMLQDLALGRAKGAISDLMKLRPDTARVVVDNTEQMVKVEDVQINQHIVVRAGERVPLDGVIIEGESNIDQSSVTGESIPVHKSKDDTLLAATISTDGTLRIAVTRKAGDSTISKIVALVEHAKEQKAHTERFLNTFEQWYASSILLITLGLIFIPHYGYGIELSSALYTAMTFLVAASPCALIISTPSAVLSALSNAGKNGILFKGGVFVEKIASLKAIAFDKTGTLTMGQPKVEHIALFSEEVSDSRALEIAGALEQHSIHPLAQAILKEARSRNVSWKEAQNSATLAGRGIEGVYESAHYVIGSLKFMAESSVINKQDLLAEKEKIEINGYSSMVLAKRGSGGLRVIAVFSFSDPLREGVKKNISALRRLGIEHLVMLSGDNKKVAEKIADQAGLDGFEADLLPEDKQLAIKNLEQYYTDVAMVGDGINDAPSLAAASIGIAMGGAGTDVALESADVVLMSDDLSKIAYAIELSQKTRQTLLVNLGLASSAIVAMVIALFTTHFPLPWAVIGHEGGTVLVCLNGLRLLKFRTKG